MVKYRWLVNRMFSLISVTLFLVIFRFYAPTQVFASHNFSLQKVYKYDVWQSTNTVCSVVKDGSTLGEYNHAPTVAVDADGSYVVLWNGNRTSGKEGANGQRIYEAVSMDGGLSWSPAFEPFTSRLHSENPVAPAKNQWQPALVRVNSQLWAFWTQYRRAPNGGTFLSKKAPNKLWKNYQLCTYRQNSDPKGDSTGISWCDAANKIPPGYSRFLLRGGKSWFLTVQQVIRNREGKILVALTAREADKSFDTAAKHIAFLIHELESDRWHLSPFIPQGVMADTDPWEVGLAEVDDGYLALIRRNQKAPVGQRLTSSFSKDGLSWKPMDFYDLALHRERPFIVKIGPSSHVLLMPDHETNRRNQSAFLRRFGGVFTPALPISNEPDGYWAHYSTGAYDNLNNRLLVVYSQNRKEDSGARDILFTRIDALPSPNHPVVIPRAFGAVKRKDMRQIASFDAKDNKLQLRGAASAGFELPSSHGRIIAHFDISKLTSHAFHPLIVIGTKDTHLQIAVRQFGEKVFLESSIQDLGAKRVLNKRAIHQDPNDVKVRLEISNGLIRDLDGKYTALVAASYAYFGDAFVEQKKLGHDDKLFIDIGKLCFIPSF